MSFTDITGHGQAHHHGGQALPHSRFYSGPYGRMFRQLGRTQEPVDEDHGLALQAIMTTGGPEDSLTQDDDSDIPAGYTYFGQFLAHDITFNPVTDLVRRRDPEAHYSFRTPRLDLDSLYGRGPRDLPYLYDHDSGARATGWLSVGWGRGLDEEDLPRTFRIPAIALIGDPRNDENTIVSQLHLAFIKLHNYFMEELGDFERAQQMTCWHYQWVVIHDYLRRVCDNEVLDAILRENDPSAGPAPNLSWFRWRDQPFIPIEFSGAAFRFGHSMVRDGYKLNFLHTSPIQVFGAGSSGQLRGFDRLRPSWSLQWDLFLEFGYSGDTQFSRRIDTSLSPSLGRLPESVTGGGPKKLVLRNLQRGAQFGIPSGQAVARAMGHDDLETELPADAPLWIFVLREAEKANKINGKYRLGKVGSTIVAETLIGLIAGDPRSYLNVEPNWQPRAALSGKNCELKDLIKAAGMPIARQDLQTKRAFSQGKSDPRYKAARELLAAV